MTQMQRPPTAASLDRLVDIRSLTLDEMSSVRHLRFQAFRKSAHSILSNDELDVARCWINSAETFEALVQATGAGQVLAGWIDETMVAVAGWTTGDTSTSPARLRWVATDPAFGNSGIGRRIVLQTEFAASAAGQSRFAVRALPTTDGFFTRVGYRQTGRGSLSVYNGLQLPVVYLSKTLRHPGSDSTTKH